MLKPFLISLGLATTAIVSACATTTSLNSAQTLDHSTWVATQIQGTQLASSNSPHIQFESSTQTFSGSDGCNRIRGSFKTENNQLKLGPVMSTKMACIGDNAAVSRQYLDALSQTQRYSLKANTLQLLDQSGKVLIQFNSSAHIHH
ncbi:META domain-containing protein [Acinetobacter junii]|uniref:META domain-containing protein n=1 Tax=Acinetobacter junii TaxID=40215 RepID=UPI0024ADA072|nr:META domain-containing protein [Acinetobacter junii]MDI6620502.1 META domain-containing protein [Acinetobacter junii]